MRAAAGGPWYATALRLHFSDVVAQVDPAELAEDGREAPPPLQVVADNSLHVCQEPRGYNERVRQAKTKAGPDCARQHRFRQVDRQDGKIGELAEKRVHPCEA